MSASIDNFNDAVNMIRHHNEGMQFYVGKFIR